MQGKPNVHHIGVALIAVSVISAFWVFGFENKMSTRTTIVNEIQTPGSLISETYGVQSSDVSLSSNSTSSSANDFPRSSYGSLDKITTLDRTVQQQRSEKSRLSEFEAKEFKLEMSGTALVSPSTMLKDASLLIKMKPVAGMNLEEFKVSEARLILDSTAMSLNLITVKIVDHDMVLIIDSTNKGEYFVRAQISEKILSDNNNRQNVLLHDQPFYIVNKDIPYKLNLTGTLTS